ncbi:MAG: response regulator [Planctomycetota bacterium]
MSYKVLLIDDSSLMRKLVSRSLRQIDLDIDKIFEASNGLEGLEQLTAGVPDLILCDWNMPEMDGITFVQEACKKGAPPIIMLTTEMSDGKKAEALNAGAKGYITKPFTPERIAEVIQQVMGS